jgi:pimeloyl-ACP methyl ester carboxylesterase
MFQLLTIDPHRFEVHVLTWIPPHRQESLPEYARRMTEQIADPPEPYLLAGVSLGGMIAVEIAKIRPPAKLILISSIKAADELPGYLRFLGKLGWHWYLPLGWAKIWRWPFAWIFGAKTATEKKLLDEIIQATDIPFTRWAFTAIVNWQNQTQIPDLVHLHGNQDKIFPLGYIRQPTIYPGGHLIIFSAAAELSTYITKTANRIFYRN